MPAAAVIPAPQVAITVIGPKASVVGFVSLLLNYNAQRYIRKRYCEARDQREVRGIHRGAVKCDNPMKTTCGEGA